MKRILIALAALPLMAQGQTLEECQQAATRNYPLIRQLDLIGRTTDLTISNLSKAWLPQVTAYAKATVQNNVTEFPEQMQTLYEQVGIQMEGLSKDQYRLGVDIQQTLFDGGATRRQKEVARLEGAASTSETEVALYKVRQRVSDIYFCLLMLDEQLKLNADLLETLTANERKVHSMSQRGTASESDHNAVRAELLRTGQQTEDLKSQRSTMAAILSLLCGIDVGGSITHPLDTVSTMREAGVRPEQRAIDAQLSLVDAREEALSAKTRPRLALFAQGFYGSPGLNMFEDMVKREWSVNGIVGLSLTWSISALYTQKNDRDRLQIQREMAETSRELFNLNNSIEQTQHKKRIEHIRNLMAVDREIIGLCESVRKSAETRLAHGTIDVSDLLREIHAENAARVQLSVHEVELLKEIYDLKFTINK